MEFLAAGIIPFLLSKPLYANTSNTKPKERLRCDS